MMHVASGRVRSKTVSLFYSVTHLMKIGNATSLVRNGIIFIRLIYRFNDDLIDWFTSFYKLSSVSVSDLHPGCESMGFDRIVLTASDANLLERFRRQILTQSLLNIRFGKLLWGD